MIVDVTDTHGHLVLIVEDDPSLRRALARTFEPVFDGVLTAASAAEALVMHSVHGHRIDVVVCDVGLPDGDGIELIRSLRATDRSLGAVVTTGLGGAEIARRATDLGVQGYLCKPYGLTEVAVNAANARRWRALDQENHANHDRLEILVESRTAELRQSQWDTIQRLALAAERRDEETGNHLERMSAYSGLLARRAGFSRAGSEEIRMAAPMHDIGKIAIPDAVLHHSGPFDDEQKRVMAQHTVIGHEILQGTASPLLGIAARIARSHHEWWDGTGYPDRSAGEEIPIEARIVAIADVFDALCSRRRDREAFTIDDAVAAMRAQRRTHFDPRLLDLFLHDLDEVLFIRRTFADDRPVLSP